MDRPVHVERDVLVTMRDGVRLATDIFRPAGAGPFPALLKRTPYGKKQSELISAESIASLVDHGYAVVMQDVRGRFNSEGSWTPFVHEMADGVDTIAWLTAQSWAASRIGMFGGSYLGLAQLLAAAGQPQGLAAIVPALAPSDLHRDWVYRGDDVLDLLLSVGWAASAASDTARRTGVDDASITSVERAFGRFVQLVASGGNGAVQGSAELLGAMEPLFCAATRADATAFDGVLTYVRDWLKHPRGDGFWSGISPAAHYARMSTPGLHIAGWYDAFLNGTLANFTGLLEQAATMEARVGQRLIVGPWLHAAFEPCPPHVIGEVDFGPQADLDYPETQLRWFDHWLKGATNRVPTEAPVRLFVMGENCWREEHEWPLARTRWRSVYLRTAGDLTFDSPAGESSSERYHHRPGNPVPTVGGALLPGAALAGPFDQRAIERRPDVLVYTSEALDADLEVTGPLRVELWVSSSAPLADFIARLVDVHPDGRALNLCEGIIRTSVAPGSLSRASIDLGATSNVFRAGHRLRLDICSSSYPHYAPNTHAAEQTIFHDGAHPSHLVLPIIPR